jgi:hypothetical protein
MTAPQSTIVKAVALAAMVLANAPALADNQNVPVTGPTTIVVDTSPFTGSFIDLKNFVGLAPGLYDFDFSFSGFNINLFAPAAITFDGMVVPTVVTGPLTAGLLSGTLTVGASPVTFALAGTASPGGAYVGILNVTPVPEPETYALFAAGLAAMGFMLRRRTKG